MNSQTYSTKKMPSTSVPPVARQTVRRKCACGGTPGPTGECAACRRKRLQRERQAATKQRGPSPKSSGNPESVSAPGLTPHRTGETRPGYNFGRLRLEAGLRNRPVEARCSMEGGCPEDPLVDYQGSGQTWCDTASGQMRTTLTEHCAGNCVAQHEAVHRQDRQDCCSGVKRCLDRASDAAGRQTCIDLFNAWFPKLSDWTECNAYTQEVICLTNLIGTGCSAGGGISANCCRTLRGELAFANRQKTAHCAAAVFEPCPFPSAPGDYPIPAPNAPRYA